MQRGAHFFEKKAFPCSVALKVLGVSSESASPKKHSKPFISNGLERFLGTLFWRPFLGRNAAMQRGAQSVRREFGGRALPSYVFQYMGLRRFFRVACLALSRFVFR